MWSFNAKDIKSTRLLMLKMWQGVSELIKDVSFSYYRTTFFCFRESPKQKQKQKPVIKNKYF